MKPLIILGMLSLAFGGLILIASIIMSAVGVHDPALYKGVAILAFIGFISNIPGVLSVPQ